MPVRLLVLVTSPFLLSPVILYVYGVCTVIRYGITNNDIATVKIPAVIANLKLAEIIVESMPQLMTQVFAIAYPYYAFMDQNHVDYSISIVQIISIVTSTLGIVVATTKYIF